MNDEKFIFEDKEDLEEGILGFAFSYGEAHVVSGEENIREYIKEVMTPPTEEVRKAREFAAYYSQFIKSDEVFMFLKNENIVRGN